MWKNIEWGRLQMAIWRMGSACWITKATDTLRICNSYCCSSATVVARTPLNVTFRVLLCTEENLYIADRVWSVYCTGVFVERFSWIVFNRTVCLQVKPSGHYMYRTVVTICTAQWSLYVPPVQHSAIHVLPTHCIYVFCVDLRTNSHYVPIQH